MGKREITNTDRTVNGSKHSRRDFVKKATVGGLSVGFLLIEDQVAYATQKVNKDSRQTKLINNRNLYNGDFGIFFWNSEKWQPEGGPYSAKAIHRFVDLLADSGVDTFLINPNTKVAWYPSKVIPTVLDHYVRDDPEFFRAQKEYWFCPEFINSYQDLKEAGVDWLKEAVTACNRRNVSPWVSIRMNDPHNTDDPRDPMNNPALMKPELQLGGIEKCPEAHYSVGTRGLNYECREIRDYMFALIRELVEEYDFQGLELDWLRIPACCRPGASQKTIDMMTSWFADIRELTEAKARKTGKTIKFGMRVPGNYKMLRHIGIDIQAIAKAGMIDFLCPTNFMQTSWDMPHDRLRYELGDEIAMYGVTELWLSCLGYNTPQKREKRCNRYTCANPPALRGNAAGKLVLGADGIEQFNFFCADLARKYDGENIRSEYSALKGIDDIEFLRGKEKHYALAVTAVGHGCWVPPFDLPESIETILEPQWRKTFKLPMCSELTDKRLELIVQVIIERKEAAPEIGVGFNSDWPVFECEGTDKLFFTDRSYARHIPEHQAYNFHFGVELIKEGWNEIVVYNNNKPVKYPAQEGEKSFKLEGIELAVRKQA